MKRTVFSIITLVSLHGFTAMAGEAPTIVHLSAAQIEQAGITTTTIQRQIHSHTITAPGTVAFNGYAIADITTLVDGVVDQRFVHLGSHVKRGDALVTLSSTALAEAEARYLQAQAEYHRAEQERMRLADLAGQQIVSQARLQQAVSNAQTAHAHLAASQASLYAYGLDEHTLDRLLKKQHYGQLTLRAPHAGTVVADDFRLGQHIAAGNRLMQVVDESRIWVEVNIPESQLRYIRPGEAASVLLKQGQQRYGGRVLNIHHQLDPATRTAGVRLEIVNRDDALHPGMFVESEITAAATTDKLLLPTRAVQRQGDQQVVFIRKDAGDFVLRVVQVGQPEQGFVPVESGVQAGDNVVVHGSFSLLSELMKSSFADED